MYRALMIILVFVFAISTSAYGEELFTVSGEINFQEEGGEFLVQLKTEQELENDIKTVPPSRELLIKPNSTQLKAKKITFKFTDVPAGTYCIRCLHDLNKNGKMDRVPETGMPAKPYGYSGPLAFGKPMWEDVSFKVDKNISDIEIKL